MTHTHWGQHRKPRERRENQLTWSTVSAQVLLNGSWGLFCSFTSLLEEVTQVYHTSDTCEHPFCAVRLLSWETGRIPHSASSQDCMDRPAWKEEQRAMGNGALGSESSPLLPFCVTLNQWPRLCGPQCITDRVSSMNVCQQLNGCFYVKQLTPLDKFYFLSGVNNLLERQMLSQSFSVEL